MSEFKNDIVFGRFINYMKKALLHKRIDYLRHQNYLKRKEKLLDKEEWIVLSSDDDIVCSSFKFEEKDLIKDALKILTEKQRKVIFLNINKKMTLKKIGQELNISTKAAEQIKARAIARLKKYLEGLK